MDRPAPLSSPGFRAMDRNDDKTAALWRCVRSIGRVTMPPLLDNKHVLSPSVFRPAALLREGRRQRQLADVAVPAVCVLDPDGDIVRQLRKSAQARPFESWPCYHTSLDVFTLGKRPIGIVGCAVGSPFAVLVAEELFASGCRFLLSVTSAGQIVAAGKPPYFIIIDRALRDEGTSYHYAAPADFAEASPELVAIAASAAEGTNLRTFVGATWTTDAPFRETREAITAAQAKGLLAVEMEAAALYSFARATNANVLCIAHVTNRMGQSGDDFEKGEADGTTDALKLLDAIVSATMPAPSA